MSLSNDTVTLNTRQIAELNEKLNAMRHDVNNYLSLVMAAGELIRRRPETAERKWQMLVEQPEKIKNALTQFARDFETTLRLTKS